MIIEIDVPETTYAISVTVLYHNGQSDSMTSRCFSVTDGVVADAEGNKKVVVNGTEGKP